MKDLYNDAGNGNLLLEAWTCNVDRDRRADVRASIFGGHRPTVRFCVGAVLRSTPRALGATKLLAWRPT